MSAIQSTPKWGDTSPPELQTERRPTPVPVQGESNWWDTPLPAELQTERPETPVPEEERSNWWRTTVPAELQTERPKTPVPEEPEEPWFKNWKDKFPVLQEYLPREFPCPADWQTLGWRNPFDPEQSATNITLFTAQTIAADMLDWYRRFLIGALKATKWQPYLIDFAGELVMDAVVCASAMDIFCYYIAHVATIPELQPLRCIAYVCLLLAIASYTDVISAWSGWHDATPMIFGYWERAPCTSEDFQKLQVEILQLAKFDLIFFPCTYTFIESADACFQVYKESDDGIETLVPVADVNPPSYRNLVTLAFREFYPHQQFQSIPPFHRVQAILYALYVGYCNFYPEPPSERIETEMEKICAMVRRWKKEQEKK